MFKVLINPLHEVIHDKEGKKILFLQVLGLARPCALVARPCLTKRVLVCPKHGTVRLTVQGSVIFLKKNLRPARACVHDARPCACTTRAMHYHINRAA